MQGTCTVESAITFLSAVRQSVPEPKRRAANATQAAQVNRQRSKRGSEAKEVESRPRGVTESHVVYKVLAYPEVSAREQRERQVALHIQLCLLLHLQLCERVAGGALEGA
eukprot:4576921-Prymnesium_polylepis.1